MNFATTLIAVTTMATAITAVPSERLVYTGRDGNWFNAGNWSAGRIPSPGDSVMIPSGNRVLVDPAQSPTGYEVKFEDLIISSNSIVETMPGIEWETRNEICYGQLVHRGTNASSDLGGFGYYAFGLKLNPTPKTKRDIVLKSTFSVQIDGATPAAAGEGSRGRYAHLTAERMTINPGTVLEIEGTYLQNANLAEGQRFTIVNAGEINGQFKGLRQGALVQRFRNVGLYIHYSPTSVILYTSRNGR